MSYKVLFFGLLIYACIVWIGMIVVYRGLIRRDFDGYPGHKVALTTLWTIGGWPYWYAYFLWVDAWRKFSDVIPEWAI